MTDLIEVLYIGDIIGSPGRVAVKRLLPGIITDYGIGLVIANGENAAGGFGITPSVADELFGLEIDVITSGNHIWDKKEIIEYIDGNHSLLRPANYPNGVPGSGHCVFESPSGVRIGVLNLCGRVFMDNLDCPFKVGEKIISLLGKEVDIIIVDMHAETTSEKAAMAWFLDGRVSAIIGSHTHVQTADERLLAKGTAFISDAGMTGSMDSVIGMKKEIALERFLTQISKKFEVAKKDLEFQGVIISIDKKNGKAVSIKRIKIPV